MMVSTHDDAAKNRPPRRTFAALCRVMRQDMRNNFGWTRPGTRALLVYRLGAWIESLNPSLVKNVLRRIQLSMHRYVRNAYGIEIYSTATIGEGVIIGHQSGIVIHEFARIGNDCLIRQGVTLGIARGHGQSPSPENAPTLGDRVDIGAGAVIMGAVTIGDDVRIFPNAVVLTNVPSNTTVMAATSRLVTMGGGAAASHQQTEEEKARG